VSTPNGGSRRASDGRRRRVCGATSAVVLAYLGTGHLRRAQCRRLDRWLGGEIHSAARLAELRGQVEFGITSEPVFDRLSRGRHVAVGTPMDDTDAQTSRSSTPRRAGSWARGWAQSWFQVHRSGRDVRPSPEHAPFGASRRVESSSCGGSGLQDASSRTVSSRGPPEPSARLKSCTDGS